MVELTIIVCFLAILAAGEWFSDVVLDRVFRSFHIYDQFGLGDEEERVERSNSL